jgi:hypothetical protein
MVSVNFCLKLYPNDSQLLVCYVSRRYIHIIHTYINIYLCIYIYIHTYINIHDLHLRMFGLLTSQDLYAVGGAGAWNCWGA